jgi:hypothetical protein
MTVGKIMSKQYDVGMLGSGWCEDISHPVGLNIGVVSDNMSKVAALHSVQIAEILIAKYLN